MNIRYRSAAWVGAVVVLVAAALIFLIARPIDQPSPASADQPRPTTSTPLAGAPTPTAIPTQRAVAPTQPAVAPTPPAVATPTVAATPSKRPPPGPTPTTGTSATQAATSGRCVSDVPDRLVIPSLGVDAPFEKLGLDTSAPADSQGRQRLGSPSDRTKAGWYAAGPRPGSGRGTVLTNGHTYRDGSAIFTERFSSQVAVGQRIDIRQRGGGLCSYRIDRVWREVSSATDYPRIVTQEHLYDFGGPERLFLTTCSGSFNFAKQNYNDITFLTALPIGRG